MPGTPVIYYGDEIGMGDNIRLGDRDGVRTPMQWSPDRNGGFSRADPAALALPAIMDALYGYEIDQRRGPDARRPFAAALDAPHLGDSIASRAPVCSPTEIIWVTIGGNTPETRSGSARVLPSVTAARHCSTAFSTTLLPAVRAVIRRPSRMGTPDWTRVPSVRVKRATATFRIRVPKIGSLSIRASMVARPPSVR